MGANAPDGEQTFTLATECSHRESRCLFIASVLATPVPLEASPLPQFREYLGYHQSGCSYLGVGGLELPENTLLRPLHLLGPSALFLSICNAFQVSPSSAEAELAPVTSHHRAVTDTQHRGEDRSLVASLIFFRMDSMAGPCAGLSTFSDGQPGHVSRGTA